MLPFLLALAQAPPEFERPFRVRDGNGEIEVEAGHASPHMVDLDHDGLSDLLVGQGDGRVRWYRNVGASKTPRYESFAWIQADGRDARVPLRGGLSSTPRLADVTGDGLHDLVASGPFERSAFVFPGRSDGTFGWREPLLPFSRRTQDRARSQIALGDWDRDGDVDLVSMDGLGAAWLFTNLAGPSARARFDTGRELDRPGQWLYLDIASTPELADWDGDGFLDLLVGTWEGEVRVQRGHGTTGCEPAVSVLDAPTHCRPCVFDWNGDGLLDLLVGVDVETTGPEPFLTAEQRGARAELEVCLGELRWRLDRTEQRVRGEVLRRHDATELRVLHDDRLEETIRAEVETALELDAAADATRAAMATLERALAPLQALHEHRSTVWVHLRKATERR